MGKFKYKFTLFTPCYNSAPFIDRIFRSIDGQTFRNFEWIVINDNSTDNTSELIREYIKKADFPVKFFDLSENKMLAHHYNLVGSVAEGELLVLMDHDDYYYPNMLSLYNELYERYNGDNIGGLTARCRTQYGRITPNLYTKPIMTYWEYGRDKNGRYTGETPRVLKMEVLRKYLPFDEEERHNPLIEGLMACDGYKFITSNEIVREYYLYENVSSLSLNYAFMAKHSWLESLRELNDYSPNYYRSNIVHLENCSKYALASIRYGLRRKEAVNHLKYYKREVSLVYPFSLMRYQLANNKLLYYVYSSLKIFIEKHKYHK